VKKLWQQGDVLCFSGASVPGDAVKIEKNSRGHVLAEGESTGHAHVVDSDDCEMFAASGRRWLNVTSQVIVKHEEHGPLTLDEGVYEIKIVREMDPFEREIKNVAD
jgi:hypothetical protein